VATTKKLAKAQKNKSRPTLLGKGAIKAIHSALDGLFDKLKAKFLGPKALGEKQIRFTYVRDMSLPGLYESGLIADGAKPNTDTLDSLLHVAGGYVDALRENAKSNVVHTIQSFIREAHQRDIQTDFRTILGGQLADIWAKTSTKLETIVDTEATKVRNVSALEGILEINASRGIEDAVVYWIVVKDGALCNECRRLHLMGDGHTPRLWYMSEVKQGYHKRGEDAPAIGGLHPHCLTGNMRIHTDRGMLTAKELFEQGGNLKAVVDERVKVRRQGNNQFGAELEGQVWYHRHASGARLLDATHVYDTGVQPCYRIELDSGHVIEVSEGHEMWVDDGNAGVKIRADKLKVGDKVPLLSGEGAFGSDSFPELAELMGNLMGDGTLNDTAQFHFFGDDIEYGRHLKAMAVKFSDRLDGEMTVYPPNDKYSVDHATFNSQVLRRIFVEEFGLSKTPRRVPARIWGADKATVAGYVRGLFAADGHSEVTPSVVLAQNDSEFLREIQALLSNFGIRSRIFKHDEAMQKTITYADGSQYVTERKECWRLHVGGWEQVNRFATEIGLGVPAKQRKLLERLEATKENGRHGAWRTAKVLFITLIGEQQTYCLTEHKTNTITVNGIVTGNCRCSMVTLLPGYGFDAGGKVEFKKFGYNAINVQRGTNKAEDAFPGLLLAKDEHQHDES
jgi:intein/homing endonuclease